jgi:hypothetical protein
VLTKKVFPREEAVWIDGGIVSVEEDFWDSIIEQLNLFQSTEKEISEVETTLGGKGTAEANFLVAKGSGQLKAPLSNAGLEFFVTYNLRHSCASRLSAAGVSDLFVAQMIGHTSPGILHSKAIDEYKRDAVRKLENLRSTHAYPGPLIATGSPRHSIN